MIPVSLRLRNFLSYGEGHEPLLFDGLRLLVTNWRLTLVQVLPAVWIWVAMTDLKAHVLHGHSFTVLRGPVLIPIALVIVAITIACFFLNAVFAFAITQSGRPEIRPAVAEARRLFEQLAAELPALFELGVGSMEKLRKIPGWSHVYRVADRLAEAFAEMYSRIRSIWSWSAPLIRKTNCA